MTAFLQELGRKGASVMIIEMSCLRFMLMVTHSATPRRGGCLGCLEGCGFHAYEVFSFRRRLRAVFYPFHSLCTYYILEILLNSTGPFA